MPLTIQSTSRLAPGVLSAILGIVLGVGHLAVPARAVAQPAPAPLRVLRVTPTDSAGPGAIVDVVFERPPARPAAPGDVPVTLRGPDASVAVQAVWADPVTLRLVPVAPLAAGRTYTVTVAPGLTAVDGGRLAGPARFTFVVRPPALLASDAQLSAERPVMLAMGGRVRLLYETPLDSAALARGAQLTFTGGGCAEHAAIAYRVVAQRAPTDTDPWPFRGYTPAFNNGGRVVPPDATANRFGRVIELVPAAPVPEGCRATFAIRLDPSAAHGPPVRYAVQTKEPFALIHVQHDEDADSTLDLVFTAPVQREELAAHLHLDPTRPFTIPRVYTNAPQRQWRLHTGVPLRSAIRVVVDSTLRDSAGRAIGNHDRTATLVIPGLSARIGYDVGLVTTDLAPGSGLPVVRVRHRNVARAELVAWTIPDSLRPRVLGPFPVNARSLAELGVTDSVRVVVSLAAPRDTERVTAVPLPAALAERGNGHLWGVRVRVLTAALGPTGQPECVLVPSERACVEHVDVAQESPADQPLGFVQGGDLAVHVKGARDGAAALVTRRSDGRPVEGARVTLFDSSGTVRAVGTTAADGLVTLTTGPRPPRHVDAIRQPPDANPRTRHRLRFGGGWFDVPAVVEAASGTAHVARPLVEDSWRYAAGNLSPYALGATVGRGVRPRGTLYTDRGYYRPGEMVHFAATLREGLLGALRPPPVGDSVRLVVRRGHDYLLESGNAVVQNDSDAVRDTVLRTDGFGTLVDSLRIASGARLDAYSASVALWRDGAWRPAATATYEVAEYRAPEFLVSVALDSTVRVAGDTVHARVDPRLLFDAPMPGATLRWRATLAEAAAVSLPGLPPTWRVGDHLWSEWGGPFGGPRPAPPDIHSGTVTLGRTPEPLAVPTSGDPRLARPATFQLEVGVTDLNRQVVTRSASITVHAARVYLAARDSDDAVVWGALAPRTLQILALRPDGRRLGNLRVRFAVLSAHREGGSWIADTVARDSLRVGPVTGTGQIGDTTAPATIRLTPPRAGPLAVVLRTEDDAGRTATTTLTAWVVGANDADWGWQRRSPVQLPLLVTRSRLAAGDSAELRYSSPFPEATAWITVERERVLRSWAVAVREGPQLLHIPVTAADAPNVYVGVTLIPRGPSADSAPSPEQRLRAGYAMIDITPDAQRLAVTITPHQRTYAPGDSARLTIRTTGGRGRPVPAAVTLWAVDEGVLALGDYTRPDPHHALYTAEGLGWVLSSTLTRLGTPLPAWVGGISERRVRRTSMQLRGADVNETATVRRRREVTLYETDSVLVDRPLPAPPPGADMAAAVGGAAPRRDFRSTAFFLGGLHTDADGTADAHPVLPDNLTTFRVVAIATSAGDAYGGADTSVVATKPVTVRAALPRFVRAGDSLLAGAVVTWRDTSGVAPRAAGHLPIRVAARASGGLALHDPAPHDTTLAPSGSAEVRWRWNVPTRRAAAEDDDPPVRLDFAATTNGSSRAADAVRVTLPVRPAYVPRTYAVTGTLSSSPGAADTVRLALPPGLDLERSRVELTAGPTPAVAVRAAVQQLLAYPYDCTEQLTSVGRGLVAWLRIVPRDSTRTAAGVQLQAVVDALARRQRPDGAFGYWTAESWSTAWLSAEVGRLLLDARAAGAAVPADVTEHLRDFLADSASAPRAPRDSLFGTPAQRREASARALGGQLAALAYLRRTGDPNEPAERALAARVGELVWEDRASFVALLAARGEPEHARALLDVLWRGVGRAGARAELPDSLLRTVADFPSRTRPAARLLLATHLVHPIHSRLGELAAMLQQRARSEENGWWNWNTQDLAAAAEALAAVSAEGKAAGSVAGPPPAPTQLVPLAAHVTRTRGQAVLAMPVPRAPGAATAAPTFYALVVHAVPLATGPGVRAAREDSGLTVERWVEPLDTLSGDLSGAAERRVHTIAEDRDGVAAGALVRVYLRVTAPADREFVALEDPLPAGLEAVDLSLRTSGTLAPFVRGSGAARPASDWWSPWEHTEQRDDAVRWYARHLASGTYTVSYVARATTAGRFVRVPAHAEEMYDAALAGRTDGGTLLVRDDGPPLVTPRR